MTLMKWDESYSVKIPSIDAQHKEILEMINELDTGVAQGRAKDALGGVLAKLFNYTEKHFKYEEDLFEQTHYELSEDHIKEHETLRQSLINIKDKFEEEDAGTIALDTVTFLRDWLLNHIKGTDMQYSEHLLKNNIK